MNYKLITKWYYVPSKLHKINPDISPLCWRDAGWWNPMLIYGGNALWSSHIGPYWEEVLYLIKKIGRAEIGQDPWQCLFHVMVDSRKNYRAAITPFLLNAAKALIPKKLKSKKIPTTKDWFREVDKTRLMEVNGINILTKLLWSKIL